MTAGRGAILWVVLGLAGCAAATAPDPDVITVAVANAPTNLDPRVGSDEASQRIHQLLYNSLVRVDDDLRVVPELASSVEVPDPCTYIVHLRQGVRFHDGHVLTAEDVAYTFRSFLDPGFVSPRKGAYRLLKAVEVVDPLTVRFILAEPFGSFDVNLVMGIVPAGSPADLSRRPVGTGPYRLTRFAVDDQVVLRAFDEHFQGAPRNRGLVIRVVPDDTMRGLELLRGSVDLVVNDLAPDIVHQLQADASVRLETSPGTDYAYIGLNLRDRALRDRRVRHAIGFAIDRRAIVDHLRRGFAVPAVGLVPRASWAFEPQVFDFTLDRSRAQRLLDEAGYPDPDGAGPLPRLKLSLKTSTSEIYRTQAAALQHDLRQVGIEIEVRSYEFATLYADVLAGNFQLYTLQWVGVSDPDMLRRVFHSKQMPPLGFNRGFYEQPEVDLAIDAATVALDQATRRARYREAQRLIAVDSPYISLWTKTNVAAFRPDLQGVRLSPSATFSFLKDVSRRPPASATR